MQQPIEDKSQKQAKEEEGKTSSDGNKPTYVKHLIECKCVLPQFKHVSPIVWHSFVVFSEIVPPDGFFVQSLVRCNNCGAVHKITEVGESVLLAGKEDIRGILGVEDYKTGNAGFVPEKLRTILEKEECELPVWQEISFIFQHQVWGSTVVLSRDKVEASMIVGKAIQVLGESLWRVSGFTDSTTDEIE